MYVNKCVDCDLKKRRTAHLRLDIACIVITLQGRTSVVVLLCSFHVKSTSVLSNSHEINATLKISPQLTVFNDPNATQIHQLSMTSGMFEACFMKGSTSLATMQVAS